MLDKIARAIVDEIARQDQLHDGDDLGSVMTATGASVDMIAVARAVLLAIRQPSDAMLSIGEAMDIDLEWQSSDKAVPLIWQAMVDAALAEQP